MYGSGKQMNDLFKASSSGNVSEIKRQLTLFKEPVNGLDKKGNTALYLAAEENRIDAIKCLIENGADVNLVCNKNFTPLLAASNEGNASIVSLLLASGADINHKNQNGWTALMLASYFHRITCIEILLKAGADVHTVSASGQSALYLAIKAAVATSTASTTPSVSKTSKRGQRDPLIDIYLPPEPPYEKGLQAIQLLLRYGADMLNSYAATSATASSIAAAGGQSSPSVYSESCLQYVVQYGYTSPLWIMLTTTPDHQLVADHVSSLSYQTNAADDLSQPIQQQVHLPPVNLDYYQRMSAEEELAFLATYLPAYDEDDVAKQEEVDEISWKKRQSKMIRQIFERCRWCYLVYQQELMIQQATITSLSAISGDSNSQQQQVNDAAAGGGVNEVSAANSSNSSSNSSSVLIPPNKPPRVRNKSIPHNTPSESSSINQAAADDAIVTSATTTIAASAANSTVTAMTRPFSDRTIQHLSLLSSSLLHTQQQLSFIQAHPSSLHLYYLTALRAFSSTLLAMQVLSTNLLVDQRPHSFVEQATSLLVIVTNTLVGIGAIPFTGGASVIAVPLVVSLLQYLISLPYEAERRAMVLAITQLFPSVSYHDKMEKLVRELCIEQSSKLLELATGEGDKDEGDKGDSVKDQVSKKESGSRSSSSLNKMIDRLSHSIQWLVVQSTTVTNSSLSSFLPTNSTTSVIKTAYKTASTSSSSNNTIELLALMQIGVIIDICMNKRSPRTSNHTALSAASVATVDHIESDEEWFGPNHQHQQQDTAVLMVINEPRIQYLKRKALCMTYWEYQDFRDTWQQQEQQVLNGCQPASQPLHISTSCLPSSPANLSAESAGLSTPSSPLPSSSNPPTSPDQQQLQQQLTPHSTVTLQTIERKLVRLESDSNNVDSEDSSNHRKKRPSRDVLIELDTLEQEIKILQDKLSKQQNKQQLKQKNQDDQDEDIDEDVSINSGGGSQLQKKQQKHSSKRNQKKSTTSEKEQHSKQQEQQEQQLASTEATLREVIVRIQLLQEEMQELSSNKQQQPLSPKQLAEPPSSTSLPSSIELEVNQAVDERGKKKRVITNEGGYNDDHIVKQQPGCSCYIS